MEEGIHGVLLRRFIGICSIIIRLALEYSFYELQSQTFMVFVLKNQWEYQDYRVQG